MADFEKDAWLFYKGVPIDFEVPKEIVGPIHTIGDSHVNILRDVLSKVFVHLVPRKSISAYAIQDKRQNEFDKYLSQIPIGDKLLSYFGEIDCRHYVPKIAREQNRTIENIVTEIVERYSQNFLSLLKDKYRLIVLSPYIGPDDHNHTNYTSLEKWSNSYNEIFEAKKTFTELIRKYCESEGIAYVPTYEVSLQNSWDTAPIGTYFNDTSHLGPCMIPLIFDSIKGFKWKGFDY